VEAIDANKEIILKPQMSVIDELENDSQSVKESEAFSESE
jgi:hypothetical protein